MPEHQPTTDINEHAPYEQPRGVSPGGIAGGDLSGEYPNPTIATVPEAALPSAAVRESASPGLFVTGAGVDVVTVQQVMLWYADSRIATPIDITGTTASDVGFAELLELANTRGGNSTIVFPPGARIKLEKEHHIGEYVSFWTSPGGTELVIITLAKSVGTGIYALTKSTPTLGQASLELVGVQGEFKAASVGEPQTFYLGNGSGLCTYTGIEGSGETIKLTGCVGIKAGGHPECTVTQGLALNIDGRAEVHTVFPAGYYIRGPEAYKGKESEWETETPPNASDGILIGQCVGLDCWVGGFRYNLVSTTERQVLGPNYRNTGGYASLFLPLFEVAGGQFVYRSNLNGSLWANVVIGPAAYMSGEWIGAELTNAKWGIWKQAVGSGHAAQQLLMTNCKLQGVTFEASIHGYIGCPDGLGEIESTVSFDSCTGSLIGSEPVALFACIFKSVEMRRTEGLLKWTASTGAMFLSNTIYHLTIPDLAESFNNLSTHKLLEGKTTSTTVDLRNRGIQFANGRVAKTTTEGITTGTVMAPATEEKVEVAGTNYGVAGVAARQSDGFTLALYTRGTASVRVKEQSNPPTAAKAVTNATAGSLTAVPTYWRIAAVLSGGGVMGACAQFTVTPEAGKSADLTCTAPATIPHSQTITHYRIWRSTTSETFTGGYYEVTKAEMEAGYVDSGTALTKAGTLPVTNNVGCEIYGSNLVRVYGSTATGCACVASGPADNEGTVFARAIGADNGATATIEITPSCA